MMNIYPNDNEEINKEDAEDDHVPFDGFVNVNDIIRNRRSLKDASDDTASDKPNQADLS